MATLDQIKKQRIELNKDKDFLILTLKGLSNAQVFYKKNEDGTYSVKAYKGRALKPAFFYRFDTEKMATEYVANWQKKWLEHTEKSKAASAEEKVKIGDIFYSSWGYEQTNIDFYQVVEVKGSFVSIREINQLRENKVWSGCCLPDVNNFKSDEVLRRKWSNNESLRINDCAYAWMLEYKEVAGTRVYQKKSYTSYA